MLASSFDGYFDCVSSLTFSSEIFGIRRIHKSDYFAVGGQGVVHIVQLTPKNQLVEITTLKDLQIGLVQRIEVDSQALYLLEKDGAKVCTVNFSKTLEKLL